MAVDKQLQSSTMFSFTPDKMT